MLPILLVMSPLATSAPSPHDAACAVALLHTPMLLEEIKNFGGSERVTFVGGAQMPYEGNRESWWAEKKPTNAPDEALLSKMKVTAQPSAMPGCESLASLFSIRGIAFSDVFPRGATSVTLAIRVSLPAISEDGRSAILLDSVVSSQSGESSGRVCYYHFIDTGKWTLAGCSMTWIAD